MTGKEALDKLLDTLKHWQGRNTIFDKIHSKHILDELELLEKYKRAFEILKNVSIVVVDKNYITITTNAIWRNDGSGAYELLEELMKGE